MWENLKNSFLFRSCNKLLFYKFREPSSWELAGVVFEWTFCWSRFNENWHISKAAHSDGVKIPIFDAFLVCPRPLKPYFWWFRCCSQAQFSCFPWNINWSVESTGRVKQKSYSLRNSKLVCFITLKYPFWDLSFCLMTDDFFYHKTINIHDLSWKCCVVWANNIIGHICSLESHKRSFDNFDMDFRNNLIHGLGSIRLFLRVFAR